MNRCQPVNNHYFNNLKKLFWKIPSLSANRTHEYHLDSFIFEHLLYQKLFQDWCDDEARAVYSTNDDRLFSIFHGLSLHVC